MEQKQIKAALQYGGQSLRQVAAAVGLSPQNFSQKAARGSLTDEELKAIAEQIGATYKCFFEFSDGKQI